MSVPEFEGRILPNLFPTGAKTMLLAVLAMLIGVANAEAADAKTDPLEGLKIGTLIYLDYVAGEKGKPGDGSESYNEFRVNRAYLDIRKTINPWFRVRATPDATQDDTGDFKVRLKYLYGDLRPADFGPFTDMKVEAGLGHMPWLDFEQKINVFRSQGKMAIERAGVFNSADLGLSIQGNLGGNLDDAKKRTGSKSYAGKWGTWHVGVYNGGGYHAEEKNENKVFQGRLTLRPLPGAAPGLQLSVFGLSGEGNVSVEEGDNPDYQVLQTMLSYQHPWVTAAVQFWTTKGNAKGNWVDAEGDALETTGMSAYLALTPSWCDSKWTLWGRLDAADVDSEDKLAEDTGFSTLIAALAYDLGGGSHVMLAGETTTYEDNSGGKGKLPSPGAELGDDQSIQLVMQIKY